MDPLLPPWKEEEAEELECEEFPDKKRKLIFLC
jgi:hypothetical protein